MVQLAPAATLVPQLFANTNDDAPVPVTAMLVMDRAPVPVLVSVIDCDALLAPTWTEPNERLLVERDTTGPEPVPVPVRVAICGEPVALSAIDRLPFKVPEAVGLNSTETVQLAEAASVLPQVVADLIKDEALVPVIVSEVRVTVPVPVFLIVTICAAVVEPTAVEEKVRDVGESEMVRPELVPPV